MRAFSLLTIAIIVTVLFFISACKSSSEALPDEIILPDGIEVVSLELDEDEAGDLPASGTRGFSVKVTLNRAIPSGEIGIIAFAVRDVELVAGLPLCVGFVGMTNSDGTSVTRSNVFNLVCDDGKVAGRAISSAFDMDDWDRSSGERSTRIYVQHVAGIKTFLGAEIGIDGVKSNKIRVECPR